MPSILDPTASVSPRLEPRGLAARHALAEAAAREAGQLGMRLQQEPALLDVATKGVQDFVSAADRALEELLIERIRAAFPGDAVLGEETGINGDIFDAPAIWVVDPIDGTSNYVRQRAGWCVSVALVSGSEAVLGVIYDPVRDELFSAVRGGGATRNGRPIQASGRDTLDGATLGIGFSYRRPFEAHVELVYRALASGCEYRRSGTGALDMAHVADGRLDGYVELHINAWDVLAGLVLVREAGGRTNDFLAGKGLLDGNPILATGPRLWDATVALLQLEL